MKKQLPDTLRVKIIDNYENFTQCKELQNKHIARHWYIPEHCELPGYFFLLMDIGLYEDFLTHFVHGDRHISRTKQGKAFANWAAKQMTNVSIATRNQTTALDHMLHEELRQTELLKQFVIKPLTSAIERASLTHIKRSKK